MQDIPEYKALEDEEGRKNAFSKFIKRQKVSSHTFWSHLMTNTFI